MSSGTKKIIVTIEEGCRVQIRTTTKQGDYPKTIGKGGKVARINGGHFGILVDGMINEASSYGVFWFDRYELESIESEGEEMKLENGYVVARVVFEDGFNPTKKYSYALYNPIANYVEGMLAVTDLNKVCRIKDVMTLEEAKEGGYILPTKPLKGICDDSHYNKMLESAAKKKEIKAAMDAKVRQLEKDAVYELYATRDPELAKLLEEYKAL